MRTPTTARSIRSLTSLATILVALLGGSGCAMLRATVGAYEVGPAGIARPQQRLREALARADFPAALGWREDDALLRALNVGVSSYYALQFARSAALLDSAALLADDRITASVSKDALALITNDLARPYQPRRTERLFIPYYGILAYARLEQWEEAAVEARRLSALLAQYASGRTDEERPTHATLHYLAGAVFERAGERNEAQVAYRNAQALLPTLSDSNANHVRGDGEVLVVVERGFVAHRATESINVFLGGSECDSLRNGDDDARSRTTASLAERLARIASGHGPSSVLSKGAPPRRNRGHDHDDDDDDADGYWLSVAFPSVRRSHRVTGAATVFVDGASASSSRVVSLLDDAALADEHRERGPMLARAVARAAAKYAITKVVKEKKGEVAGTIANIGASLLERADVRSWHLLPQEITLLRVRLPAGQHQLQVAVGSGDDSARADVGAVTVRAGQVSIAAVRLWNDPQPKVVAVR